MRTLEFTTARLVLALLLLSVGSGWGQTLQKTQIQDTLFNADGSKVEGTVMITWKSFTAVDGSTVVNSTVDVPIVQGLLSVGLTPNEGAVPSGTSYRANYTLNNGRRFSETWIVPISGSPVTVSDVRVSLPPTIGQTISQGQVTGLVDALDQKAGLDEPNVFTGLQTIRESVSGETLLGLQEVGGGDGVFFRIPLLSASTTYTFPSADGLPNQRLTTDGTGNLFWSSGGAGAGAGTAYEVIQSEGVGLTQRNVMNFSNGFSVFDNPGQTRTEIQPMFGAFANTIAEGNDPRLSDDRNPLAHASSHFLAASDAIDPVQMGALKRTNDTIVGISFTDPVLRVKGMEGQSGVNPKNETLKFGTNFSEWKGVQDGKSQAAQAAGVHGGVQGSRRQAAPSRPERHSAKPRVGRQAQPAVPLAGRLSPGRRQRLEPAARPAETRPLGAAQDPSRSARRTHRRARTTARQTSRRARFFRTSLSRLEPRSPDQRRRWRERIYSIVEQISAKGSLSVEHACELGRVNRAGFYRRLAVSSPAECDMELRDRMQRISLENRRYGYRRVTAELRRQGFLVNHKKVLRMMRKDNLLAVLKRRFVLTTDSNHFLPVYPNLAAHLNVDGVDQLWQSDITYIRLREAFVYLAVVLDAYSRRVVGWRLGTTLKAELAVGALRDALELRRPAAGWMHHSDQGVQYASSAYVELLEQHGAIISMSQPLRQRAGGEFHEDVEGGGGLVAALSHA